MSPESCGEHLADEKGAVKSVSSLRALAPLLDYQGKTPRLYDLESCARALAPLGFPAPPQSYVDYFSTIGFVTWTCDGDGMGIFPPQPSAKDIGMWNADFRGLVNSYDEPPLSDPDRFIMLGRIDNGSAICWDLSRIKVEPCVVVIRRTGRVVDYGDDLADFLLNHWLTGICSSSDTRDIDPERLVVDVMT